MFEFITDEEERGQVGIGTLIVFIAMVLVAAIAAGVLINTAGFLQSQAQATGQDSTNQVSDRLNVIGEAGIVATSDEADPANQLAEAQVSSVELNVRKSAGSGNVDLADATIQLIGPNGETTLTHISTEDTDDLQGSTEGTAGNFNVENLIPDTTDGDNVETTLENQEDRSKLLIPLEVGATGATAAFVEGDDVTMVITTSTGASTRITFTVPALPDELDAHGAEVEL